MNKEEEYKYSIVLTGKSKKHLKNLKRQKKDLKLLENELEKLYEIEEFLDKYEKRKLLNNKTWNSILLTGETLWYKFLKIF